MRGDLWHQLRRDFFRFLRYQLTFMPYIRNPRYADKSDQGSVFDIIRNEQSIKAGIERDFCSFMMRFGLIPLAIRMLCK